MASFAELNVTRTFFKIELMSGVIALSSLAFKYFSCLEN